MMQFDYTTQQQRVERMLELHNSADEKEQQEFYALFLGIVQDLEVLKDLATNHIDFIMRTDCCYFKIKGSKGKERSYTSMTFRDFWAPTLIKMNENQISGGDINESQI